MRERERERDECIASRERIHEGLREGEREREREKCRQGERERGTYICTTDYPTTYICI